MLRDSTRRSRFAARIEKAINETEMPQQEIAKRLGYDNANIITMFKRGTTRVPLDKVAQLARILSLDPGDLLREWFLTYYPNTLPAIEDVMGPILTSNERSWIRGLREHLGVAPRFKNKWAAALTKLVDDTGE